MVATKLTGLSAFTPILTDIAYAVDDPGGTPISGKVTFSAIRDLLQANLTSATITGATLTGSAADSLVSMTQTWNTTGTPTAIKLNVTNTASNASSLLMDLQVGGTSFFKVARNGNVSMGSGVFEVGVDGNESAAAIHKKGDVDTGIAFENFGVQFHSAGHAIGWFMRTNSNDGGLRLNGPAGIGWLPGGVTGYSTGAPDLYLIRDAANTLALRNNATPTSAQTFRIYNTTDSSTANYERAALRWNTNVFEIGSFAAGTGTLRGIMVGVSGNSLGFLGATPIAQYSTTGTTTGFTAGAGTAVNDDSTFTGNTGATAYTIGDVVRALKLYGLIAA